MGISTRGVYLRIGGFMLLICLTAIVAHDLSFISSFGYLQLFSYCSYAFLSLALGAILLKAQQQGELKQISLLLCVAAVFIVWIVGIGIEQMHETHQSTGNALQSLLHFRFISAKVLFMAGHYLMFSLLLCQYFFIPVICIFLFIVAVVGRIGSDIHVNRLSS